MALWARPMGTIKKCCGSGHPLAKVRVEVLRFLRDTGGWRHGEAIRATRGNKEPEGQIRQAIREENKSSHYAGKETTGECAAVMEQCAD